MYKKKLFCGLGLCCTASLLAAEANPSTSEVLFTVNNVWMMLCTALVFMMHLGFATVESGFTQSKNTVNILYKNIAIVCIGLLTFTIVGYGIMFSESSNGILGFNGFMLTLPENGLTSAYANGQFTFWTKFLFNAMFAATAATIVSGAVAERVKLAPFLLFSTILVAFAYPITGHWLWGNGWLSKLSTPFHDFAGSTLVHAVGGAAALVCAWMIGPRLRRYTNRGLKPILGHSMPLATIGVFMLWLGWFGFNGGSVLSANPGMTSLVLVTTNLAAAAGFISSALACRMFLQKPDLGMSLNGALAGLVSITAGADLMTPGLAIVIGGIAGILVFMSVEFFDKIKIDDPVGAISVHLVCGIWGTLAVGIFGTKAGMDQLLSQIIGSASVIGFTLIFTFIVFGLINLSIGIRVTEQAEIDGLDEHEHGAEAYPYFSSGTGLL